MIPADPLRNLGPADELAQLRAALEALIEDWGKWRFDPTMDTERHRGYDSGLMECATALRAVLASGGEAK